MHLVLQFGGLSQLKCLSKTHTVEFELSSILLINFFPIARTFVNRAPQRICIQDLFLFAIVMCHEFYEGCVIIQIWECFTAMGIEPLPQSSGSVRIAWQFGLVSWSHWVRSVRFTWSKNRVRVRCVWFDSHLQCKAPLRLEADRISFSFSFSVPKMTIFLFFGVLFFGRKRI